MTNVHQGENAHSDAAAKPALTPLEALRNLERWITTLGVHRNPALAGINTEPLLAAQRLLAAQEAKPAERETTPLPSVYVGDLTITDPDSGQPVELEIHKDPHSGGLFAVDFTYIEQVSDRVHSPFTGAPVDLTEIQPARREDLAVNVRVYWKDVDGGAASGWYVIDAIHSDSGRVEESDTLINLKNAAGSSTQALCSELYVANPQRAQAVQAQPQSREEGRYKAFFIEAFENLQDAFLPGREIGGADCVDLVAKVFNRALNGNCPDTLYLAVSGDGYWNNDDGWGEAASGAFLTPEPDRFVGLTGTNVCVIGIPAAKRNELADFPGIDDITDAAETALARAKKHGFNIDETNAAEVMNEELQLAGFTLDAPFLNQFFCQQLLSARDDLVEERVTGERR